jgi:hypothetical protein
MRRRRGEFERELCAAAGFGVDADAAAVGFDDPAGGGQAEAAAAALGAEEGVEHFHRGPLVHAAAGVDQVQGHALPRDPGAGNELPAIGHRFQGVLHQVHEGRLQRLGVELNARQVGVEVSGRSRRLFPGPAAQTGRGRA